MAPHPQYEPSPPKVKQSQYWPKIPDLITFYGALLIVLLFIRYFVSRLLRQWRRRETRSSTFTEEVPVFMVENDIKKSAAGKGDD
ncbi:hypothetical protein ASPVEDRAFT_47461 [Aspergillus versicolor CBS 583.65]|uniref:Copper transporter n=1 Tax=Aspergillus versicolor CBS 583.65 TaxID=1036611 RepID=A0A1L9Q3H8_ASPVE|nr:uncharacterized protein ASPVEDRAFT_47461 [Aspergillus versicolor CBS 583.65]OJJ08296.1 hypothetical protein ASPVEDRAFT_47461 [Aspergillus versicolor CBS 583.65]